MNLYSIDVFGRQVPILMRDEDMVAVGEAEVTDVLTFAEEMNIQDAQDAIAAAGDLCEPGEPLLLS